MGKPSAACRLLVEHFETLELEAYPDPFSPLGRACTKAGLRMPAYRAFEGWGTLKGDPWTAGWGRAYGLEQGDVTTEEEADAWCDEDLGISCGKVLKAIKAPLKQCQLDALTSLYYNCAEPKPTLEGMIAHGLLNGAADQIVRWDHVGGEVVPGLLRRRRAERLMFKGLLDPLLPGFSWPDFSS